MYTNVSKLQYLISKSIIGKIIRYLHIARFFNYPFKFYENHIWSKYDGGVVSLEDFKMYLDKDEHVISKSIYTRKTWERFETDLFKKHIREGDTVLDIGAHIGWYTLIASKIVGKKGKVYSFEPEPKSYELLKRNIELNNINNVIAFNKALSDEEGRLPLFYNLYKSGPSPYQLWQVKGEKHHLVDVIKLDDVIDLRDVNVIKIDIEGYEVKALRGMKKIIENSPNIVIFTEFWSEGLKRSGSDIQEYIDFIKNNNFQSYLIDHGKLSKIKPEEINELGSGNLLLSAKR